MESNSMSQDRYGLQQLFKLTGGETWVKNDNWCSSKPLAKWTGVIVDPTTGHVIELWLRYNGLVGEIPDALGLLVHLRHIDLEGNELEGVLPAALGNLACLSSLWLTECKLKLPPAHITKCTSREEVLSLFKEVGGDIMAKDRPALSLLFASWNGLHWTNCKNWCSSRPLNEWFGITTVQQPKKKKNLVITSPYGISKKDKEENAPYKKKLGIGRVVKIYLESNGIQGELNELCGIGALTELKKLCLYGNYLKGVLSPILSQLIYLDYVDLEENYFVRLPLKINLECKTEGDVRELHAQLGHEALFLEQVAKAADKEKERKARYERSLALSSAAAVPVVVPVVKSQPKASKQGHGSKQVSKEQAEAILVKEKTALVHFGEHAGRYHRKEHPGWCTSDGWRQDMEVGESWFGVTIDTKSGRLRQLELPSNQLMGSLSKFFTPLCRIAGKLVKLDLRCNHIEGHIPAAIGFLTSLVEVYLSLNNLRGPIPEEMGSLLRLEKLALSGNNLTGPIPASFAKLSKLASLDLSLNPELSHFVTEYMKAHPVKGKAAEDSATHRSINLHDDEVNLECNSAQMVRHLFRHLGILKGAHQQPEPPSPLSP